MKRPPSDDPDINNYIDHLIEENDELKVELMSRKTKRSLEHEYKELISYKEYQRRLSLSTCMNYKNPD
jgi:hypothetical protein